MESQLSPIPLSYLDEFPKDIAALAKAGVRTFKDLLILPSTSVKQRCSHEFSSWIDRLLCRVEVALEDFQPDPEYNDIAWLGYGSKNNQELIPAMEALLEKLSLFLRHTQLETPQLRWVFIPTQGQHAALDIRSSECHNNPKRWLEQSQLKLCLLYTSPSPRDATLSRMPSSA